MRQSARTLVARAARALELQGVNTTTTSSSAQVAAPFAISARSFANDADLLKTPLYDFHVENGGKMVPFAGWSMPIQYKDSIMEATNHCRTHASLFDVSHMCGLTLKGKDAIKFLEGLVVGDINALADGTGTLSVEKDLAHLNKHLQAFTAKGGDVTMDVHDDRSLLALQGPEAAEVLQQHVKEDLSKLYFGMFTKIDIAGRRASDSRVRLAGLGPRDSLRLEAGLCLYGNDLNEDITPVEAGLTWTIAKSRRDACDFLGGDVIKKQLADGVKQRRVGFVCKGAPARQHSDVITPEGQKVGEITFWCLLTCLKKNIAMGYVDKPFAKAGTELKVVVRGKASDAVVTKCHSSLCTTINHPKSYLMNDTRM
eukprot:jgi/Picre1/31450/NNA_006802.t1